MKEAEILILIQYRLEQAVSSLNDAKYLLEGHRDPRSIINRCCYAGYQVWCRFYPCWDGKKFTRAQKKAPLAPRRR